jgi:uroporphyrinogen-III synthase
MPATLENKKILVTRAQHQSKELVSALEELGATVIELPMISIGPPHSWQELDDAIKHVEDYEWIFFASMNSVESFLTRLKAAGISTEKSKLPSDFPLIAVIGETTRQAVENLGWSCHYSPPEAIGESFVNNFPSYPGLRDIRILWPRTNVGRTYIAEELSKAGAIVDTVEAYQTKLPENAEHVSEELNTILSTKSVDAIIFASGETARNFSSLAGTTQSIDIPAEIALISIGPETSSTMKTCFKRVDLEAKPHNVQGLVETIKAHFAGQESRK